jgi:hypothetical protein
MVMGDTEKGAAIRSSSIKWKAKVQEAITDGGSSELNLMTFQEHFAKDTAENPPEDKLLPASCFPDRHVSTFSQNPDDASSQQKISRFCFIEAQKQFA